MNLIAAFVEEHRKSAANKAAKNTEAAVQVCIKAAMLNSDLSAVPKILATYVPANDERKRIFDQTAEEAQQVSDPNYSRASLLAGFLDHDRWRFYVQSKRYQKIYDLELTAACIGWRLAGNLRKSFLGGPITNELRIALDALKADEASLDADCTSKRARKLLKKDDERWEKTKRTKAKPPGN